MRKNWICLPRAFTELSEADSGEHTLDWYQLPPDIFKSKEYPICHCGRRYVPVEKHKECYYCVLTRR